MNIIPRTILLCLCTAVLAFGLDIPTEPKQIYGLNFDYDAIIKGEKCGCRIFVVGQNAGTIALRKLSEMGMIKQGRPPELHFKLSDADISEILQTSVTLIEDKSIKGGAADLSWNYISLNIGLSESKFVGMQLRYRADGDVNNQEFSKLVRLLNRIIEMARPDKP